MDPATRQLFEDSLHRFNDEHRAPGGREAPARWPQMQALGWFELLRDDGGALAPLADLLPLFVAAGEGLWREPIGNVFGEPAAVVAATEDRARAATLLEGLSSGARPLAWAHREPGNGWRGGPVATMARRTADGYRLHGRKSLVIGAAACAAYLVSALEDDGDAGALFLVEAGAAGVAAQSYRTIDDGLAADLQFTGAPAERLCAGSAVIARAQARGALLAAAESIGILRGATHDTTEYLRTRRQFGQPLLGFQTLQHRLVEMLMRERESTALLHDVVEACDGDAPLPVRQLLALRVQVARALRHVTREAIQLHGGMGVTQELRIGRHYRRALMLDSLHGTADSALDALSEFQ